MKKTIAACALLLAACAVDSDSALDDDHVAVTLDGVVAPPLAGSDGVWTYNEVSGTQCRDGSTAGVSTNLRQYSKKLVIYLEGGGWCGDAQNCAWNNTSARDGAASLGWLVGVGGMFGRTDVRNPLRDWNYVYVPYCTGDLHSGANPEATVPGFQGSQHFVGYLNMQKFLERIVASFPDVTDVMLSGGSAGGLGALRNALLVQRAFPDARVSVFSDSGPPLSKAVFAPCMQRRERELFALERTFLGECGDACRDPDDAWLEYIMFLAAHFSGPIGVIDAIDDAGIRGFLGVGNDNCTASDLTRSVAAAPFHADLLSVRERLSEYPNVGMFYPQGDAHTWISGLPLPGFGDFHAGSAGGVLLTDWLAKLADGQAPGSFGP